MLGKQLDDDVANSEQSSIAKNNSKVLKLPTDKGEARTKIESC